MALYTQKTLDDMADLVGDIEARTLEIKVSFVLREYASTEAREFAQKGVARRLSIIAHSILKVFDILPPELERPPPQEVLLDAVVFAQSGVIHTFGLIDNLAWVVVHERSVTKPDGSSLSRHDVGLSEKHKQVLEKLAPTTRKYLESLKPWYTHLEDFRHPLAHRIPCYIPPFVVHDEDRYNALEVQKLDALRRKDVATHEQLCAEQESLMEFIPLLQQTGAPDALHPRMLSDFLTVEKLCKLVLEELAEPDRGRPS